MIVLTALLACSSKTPAPEVVVDNDAAAVPSAPVEPGLLTEEAFAALHELKAEAAPKAKGESVTIDGMQAYLALPEGAEGPVPGIVVVHEWWGLNDHIRHWADRLAALGYAAVAVDLYGGTVATTPDAAMKAMKAVNEEEALKKLRAAHQFLVTEPRVQAPKTGSIGWCFGGGWSLRLALAETELDAAVMYYGRLVSDEAQLRELKAPLLGVFGERDGGIPVAAVRAFETQLGDLDKAVAIHVYDADHAFANPSSARYDSASAGAAWEKVQAFFGEHLTP
ncbi:MAG: dienelactone hydrolase family protein [Myxococcota bacterium]